MSRRTLLAAAAVATVGATLGCSAGGRAGSTPTPSQEGPVPQQIHYGDLPSQYAELTLPPGTGQVPVVVVVHGGFWRTGYGLELGRPLAADLVPRGWATLNVEYRRVGRSATEGGGGWPQTCEDVAAAVDALRSTGQALADGRLDLGRVVALGHSAGGQLVGWLGGRKIVPSAGPHPNPAVPLSGFVAQAGVMDLVGAASEGVGGFAVSDLMGGSPAKRPDAYAMASPLALLPLGIPSVCVHGESDTTVPLWQSERFVSAAQQAGDTSELRRFDGDHFAVITVGTPAWTLCVDALTGLLTR